MTQKTKRIIHQIAQHHGVTALEVESEMNEAIRIAMSTADPKAQLLWNQLAPDGTPPSIDAFLAFCAEILDSLASQDPTNANRH